MSSVSLSLDSKIWTGKTYQKVSDLIASKSDVAVINFPLSGRDPSITNGKIASSMTVQGIPKIFRTSDRVISVGDDVKILSNEKKNVRLSDKDINALSIKAILRSSPGDDGRKIILSESQLHPITGDKNASIPLAIVKIEHNNRIGFSCIILEGACFVIV